MITEEHVGIRKVIREDGGNRKDGKEVERSAGECSHVLAQWMEVVLFFFGLFWYVYSFSI